MNVRRFCLPFTSPLYQMIFSFCSLEECEARLEWQMIENNKLNLNRTERCLWSLFGLETTRRQMIDQYLIVHFCNYVRFIFVIVEQTKHACKTHSKFEAFEQALTFSSTSSSCSHKIMSNLWLLLAGQVKNHDQDDEDAKQMATSNSK